MSIGNSRTKINANRLRLWNPPVAGISQLTIILLVSLLVGDAASAMNNANFVISCACQTTAQFTAAAAASSKVQFSEGTYRVVSTTKSMTATIQVNGYTTQYPNGAGGWVTVFIPQLETPVDATGKSLAGSAETTLQAFYGTTDQVIFGVNRASPFTVSAAANYPSGANSPALSSFVNSTDAAVSQVINNLFSQFPPGSIINVGTATVIFLDGSSAEYTQTAPGVWTWNGVAHDSAGHLILRNGSRVPNPNTSGAGGGHVSVNAPGAFNAGAYTWNLNGNVACAQIVSVVFSIGTGNPINSLGMYYTPCN